MTKQLPKFNVDMLRKFVRYVKQQLDLRATINIKLFNRPFKGLHTTGVYMPDAKTICVSIFHRALADVARTVAHELVHQKQGERGDDLRVEGAAHQKLEDEANMMAGRYVHWFGDENPELYKE